MTAVRTTRIAIQNLERLYKEVDAERDARLTAGFNFVVEGETYLVQFRPQPMQDRENITGAGALAGIAKLAGAPSSGPYRYYWTGDPVPFTWRMADNTEVSLDAHQMFAMSQAAAKWKAAHFKVASTLKDSGVPENFREDSYWPPRPE